MTVSNVLTYGIPAIGLTLQLIHALQWIWRVKVRRCRPLPPRFLVEEYFYDDKADYISFGRVHLRHLHYITLIIGVATWIVPSFYMIFAEGGIYPKMVAGNPFFHAMIYMMITLFSFVLLIPLQEHYCNYHKSLKSS